MREPFVPLVPVARDPRFAALLRSEKERATPPPEPEEEVDVEALVADALARGRAEVEHERDAALHERDLARAQVGRLVEAVEARRTAWAAEARETVAAFVLLAVRRIAGDLPDHREALLRARLADLVERLVRAREVAIRVAPADLEVARRAVGDRPGWRILADGEIGAGCVVEAEGGRIDATLSAAIEGLDELLAAWRFEGAP